MTRCRTLLVLLGLAVCATNAPAQLAPPTLTNLVPDALGTIPIPEPTELTRFVRNRSAAEQLGKALFWDMQLGSDGIQACASCHFHAGADNRRTNQVNPATIAGDGVFDIHGVPNETLVDSDFPFHKLANPNDTTSVISDANDVASSMGVTLKDFIDIVPGSAEDNCVDVFDPVFNVDGVNVRRVEPRNTPTAINAVFNFRNFWDGRAAFFFNGVDPFGPRNPDARILEKAFLTGFVFPVSVLIDNGSLASQAVGPPASDFEMSCAGRTWPKIGKKMLSLPPLAKQVVSPTDSLLGSLASSATDPGAKGLNTSYRAMVEEAFDLDYWDSDIVVTYALDGTHILTPPTGAPLTTDEYTMMEANFSLIFGLAVQLYEATLVSDDAPFDRFQAGGGELGFNSGALTTEQKTGVSSFFSSLSGCGVCHVGPELSAATISNVGRPEIFDPDENPVQEQLIEQMPMKSGTTTFYDTGFYNIGVRPTPEDLGVGGDAMGPLCFARRTGLGLESPEMDFSEQFLTGRLKENFIGGPDACDGSFKVPILRNVELTAPYFHNGGQLTLHQVVDFYSRFADFAIENLDQLGPAIAFLGLTPQTKDAIVAFLQSLTDDRVRYKSAPFDHPEIFIPVGHPDDAAGLIAEGTVEEEELFLKGGPRDFVAAMLDGTESLVGAGSPLGAPDLLLRVGQTGAEGHCVGIDGTSKPGLAFPTTSCDDYNPCTLDFCDPTFECQHFPVTCNDGDSCTIDSCDAELGCVHTPDACSDGNPCTDDSCDAVTGCSNVANADFCDDGDACTVGDVCDAGACAPGAPLDCDDGDVCTLDTCDAALGCSNPSAGLCENLVCVAAADPGASFAGEMTFDGQFTAGTDADPALDSLTSQLVYAAGSVSEFSAGSGHQVAYTVDLPAGGDWALWARLYYPAAAGSNAANSFFASVDGGAVSKLGNNQDYYQQWHWDGEGTIETGPLTGISLGTLAAGPHTVLIEKREVTEGAQPRLDMLCFNRSVVDPPSDADALAVGSMALCASDADCDDGNECTDNVCDASGVCMYPTNTDPCDDGLFCNGTDTCQAGSCSGHAGDPCAGGAACADQCDESVDSCDVPAGSACDDGVGCTGNDVCAGGTCVGVSMCPGGEICELATDSCQAIACTAAAECDDGNACNGMEFCDVDTCAPGTAPDCDDGDACTDNACDPATGCMLAPVVCDDGDACTIDSCDAAVGCMSAPLDCDDSIACTSDTCDAGACVNTDACTAGTVCNLGAGICEAGPDLICIAAGSDPTAAFAGAMTTGTQFTNDADADPVLDNLTSPLVYANASFNDFKGGSGDQVTYTVVLPDSAQWFMWGRLYYPGSAVLNSANSFFANIDGGPSLKFGNNKDFYQQWHWDGDGQIERGAQSGLSLGTLSAGAHQVVIEKREVVPAGLQPRLDMLCFTKSGTEIPFDDAALTAAGN
ncbi:MAG: cytochrome c peroxidase [Candidatus Binatia bacterium]